MTHFTFTFIIPHHNCPLLLDRCITSIPDREDIQIIVIDDGSDKNIFDYQEWQPQRKNVEIYGYNDSRGAGYARNVGLTKANGSWLLFADADDFYVDGFLDVLDPYSKNNDLDIVYFSCLDIDSASLKESPIGRAHALNGYIKEALSGNKAGEDKVRFKYRSPWFKMFNASFVHKYNLTFEEVRKGNDMMFSFAASYLASSYKITDKQVYCVTFRADSMTFGKKNIQMLRDSIAGKIKVSAFNKFIGHTEWTRPLIYYILSDLKSLTFKSQFSYIKMLFKNINYFYKQKNKYVDYILSKK